MSLQFEPQFEPAALPPIKKKLFSSLSVPNFRLYISGHFISMIGVWMQTVALSWLVWRLTLSGSWLGAVGFSNWIMTFLLGLIGGAVVDKILRYKLILVTQFLCMLQATILAILTFNGMITPPIIIILVLFTGAVYAFDFPARYSFITDMVGKEQVDNAVGLSASVIHAARVIGPATAGLLVAYWSEGICFIINAVTYLAFLAAVLMMKKSEFQYQPTHDLPMYKAIKEGLGIAWNNRRLKRPLILLALISFFGMPYHILIPIFVDRVYGGGSGYYGFMMAASAIGALSGSFIMAKSLTPSQTKQKISYASLGLAISLITFAWVTKFWMGLVVMFFIGLFALVSLASINAWLQREAPDHARGRIMSLYTMMFFGALPFGSLVAGSAAENFGTSITLAVGGGVCAIASMWFKFARTKKSTIA